jgi:hypothetical protein
MEERTEIPMKLCNICQEEYLLTEFFQNSSSADGHGYTCKPCSNLETQYRNMKSKYQKNYLKHFERHRMLAKRYGRLMSGMSPREAAIDELADREKRNA